GLLSEYAAAVGIAAARLGALMVATPEQRERLPRGRGGRPPRAPPRRGKGPPGGQNPPPTPTRGGPAADPLPAAPPPRRDARRPPAEDQGVDPVEELRRGVGGTRVRRQHRHPPPGALDGPGVGKRKQGRGLVRPDAESRPLDGRADSVQGPRHGRNLATTAPL